MHSNSCLASSNLRLPYRRFLLGRAIHLRFLANFSQGTAPPSAECPQSTTRFDQPTVIDPDPSYLFNLKINIHPD